MDQDNFDTAMLALAHHIAPQAPFDALEHLEHRLRQCCKYQLHNINLWDNPQGRLSKREMAVLIALLDLPWLLPYPSSRNDN